MRRSRAALTLFLGALAAALQTAGLAEVQQGPATEPAAKRQPINCYADAPCAPAVRPVAFAEDWCLDRRHCGYECYGPHGVDCYDGPVVHHARHEPVLLDAQPIDEYEYAYEWDCEACCDEDCYAYLASPRVHLEDLSHLAADSRHSSGQDEVLRMNRENEGLQAASLSTGDYPHDLPAGESFYVSRVATSRIGSGFDCDDCYGAWDGCEYADYDSEAACVLDEPEDLPPGETVLHVARPEVYSHDYEYDYSYDDAQYGEGEDAYTYDDYTESYSAEPAPASQPAFTAASGVEPADLPVGEHVSVDLPASEDLAFRDYSYGYSDDYDYSYAYDDYAEPYAANASRPSFTGASSVEPYDLPAGEQVSIDLPAGEVLTDDLPIGEDLFDDMPPAEPVDNDLPAGEFGGYDVPAHEVVSTDLPVGEDISDLPPPEAIEGPANLGRAAYRNEYECEYDYQCDCHYDVESYGNYGAKSATPVTADYSRASAADLESLRPVLRTASWMLNQMGEALLGLSRSVNEMAEAGESVNEATLMPPEIDYPWPTILGRQPNRDIHPGL